MAGAVLGLIALGFVVVFKVSGIFNLAQGELVAIGAYFSWVFLNEMHLHPALAVFLALLLGAIIGLVLSRFPFGPLMGQPMMALFIVTLGLMVLFRGVLTMIYGSGEVYYFRQFVPADPVRLPDNISIFPRDLLGFGLVVLLLIILMALFRYTRFGLVFRASAEDTQLARSIGINLKRTVAVALAIGCAIAAVGGVILGMSNGISPRLGDIALGALAVVLVGGMNSFTGTILGGLLVGIVTSLSSYYIGHGIGSVAAFIIMLIVLLFRPYGILGQKEIERV